MPASHKSILDYLRTNGFAASFDTLRAETEQVCDAMRGLPGVFVHQY